MTAITTSVSYKPRTLTLPEWDKLVQDLAKRYQSGESVRFIAESVGRSYGTVHRWLTEAGVQMRPRGGSRPKPVPVPASGAVPQTTGGSGREQRC